MGLWPAPFFVVLLALLPVLLLGVSCYTTVMSQYSTKSVGERTEVLQGGTRVFTAPPHLITSDTLLLLNFCDAQKTYSVCDLGTGCGILLLGLLDKGICGDAVGTDIMPTATALLQKGIDENNFTNAAAVCCDFREYKSPKQFDMIVSNPPYFNTGRVSQDAERAATRHQQSASITDVCLTAARLAKDKGRFCLCWPASHLQSLFAALENAYLAPKRVQFVRKTPSQSAWLALVEARKAAGRQLSVLPDIITGHTEHR